MNYHTRNRYETKLFFLKMGLFISMFAVFFSLMSIYNPQIVRPSRTAAILIMTYVILLPVLIHIYHSFEIGRENTAHIINTTLLSVGLTDIIVYFQLLIMNFNEENRTSLMPIPGEIGCFILSVLLQLCLIVLFTKLATGLHWKYNPPRKTCLICITPEDARLMREYLKTAARRYQVATALYYRPDDPASLSELKQKILEYEQIFLYNIPIEHRHILVEYCYSISKPISYSMEISDIISYGADHDMFNDISFIAADNRRGLSIEQRIAKRTLDLVLSSLMLLFLSPIMLICAIFIWLYDHESVFFFQPRATVGGKIFNICKFRTMRTNAEHNRSVQVDDDRITPVGRVLRRFRLDELPQLFNILAGDMSLVGPRPEMLCNVQSYTEEMPEFSYRLAVKAGLTGYAQIAGKYNTAPKEKMMMDLMYIEDYSIWHDIKLILQTVTVFFRKDSTEAFDKNTKKNKSQTPAA